MGKRRIKQISEKQKQINKEYQKQRDRITASIRRLSAQGYQLDFQIPAIPKRKTEASIRKLKKITPDEIRVGGIFVDYSTGEFVEAERKYTIRKLRKQQKEDEHQLEDEQVIQTFRDDIAETRNIKVALKITSWLNDYISRKGISYVADNLREFAKTGYQLDVTPYGSDEDTWDKVDEFLARILQSDPEAGVRTSEEIAEIIYDETGW